jgi:hypothetical protein
MSRIRHPYVAAIMVGLILTVVVAARAQNLPPATSYVMSNSYCSDVGSRSCSNCIVNVYPQNPSGPCPPNWACYVRACDNNTLSINICVLNFGGLGPCNVTGSNQMATCFNCYDSYCGCADANKNCTSGPPTGMNGGGSTGNCKNCDNLQYQFGTWSPMPTCT